MNKNIKLILILIVVLVIFTFVTGARSNKGTEHFGAARECGKVYKTKPGDGQCAAQCDRAEPVISSQIVCDETNTNCNTINKTTGWICK